MFMKTLKISYDLLPGCLFTSMAQLRHLQLHTYSGLGQINIPNLIKIINSKMPGLKVNAFFYSYEDMVRVIKETSPLNHYQFSFQSD